MRRRPTVIWAAALLLAVALGAAYLARSSLFGPRIDADRFVEVRRGMTVEDVSTLVGGPPGRYTRWGDPGPALAIAPAIYPSGVRQEEWVVDDGRYVVHFDRDGGAVAVEDKYCEGLKRRLARGETPRSRVLVTLSWD